MNNTFNFNRFGKLLAMDGKKYLRNFGVTLAILCSLNVATWLLTAVFGFTMPTFVRWMVIYVAVFLSCILVPAKAFGDMNLPREGVRYAMLPVSNWEKYISYVLYCILTPVAVALISYGIDSLLTLLPVGGFDNYIKSLGMIGAMSDFFAQLADPSGVLDPSDLTQDYYDAINFMERLSSVEVWNYLVAILLAIGFFMMGNLLFKTHKTGKTFGIMMGISYVLNMLIQTIMFASSGFRGLFIDPTNVDFSTISNMSSGLMTFSIIFNALLTIALYVGVFFKLKTQKY
jgi:hypothetical protein